MLHCVYIAVRIMCSHRLSTLFFIFFSLLPNLVSLEDYSRSVITDVQVTHTHQSKPDLVTSGPFIECQFKAAVYKLAHSAAKSGLISETVSPELKSRKKGAKSLF